MQVVKIALDIVFANNEARTIDEKAVERLAESMNKVGQLNPIMVVKARYSAGGRADNTCYRVVAGGHRLKAAKMLGWSEIDACVLDYAEDDYKHHRMIEITENLHRAELSALERDKLVAEWCELVGGVSVQNGQKPKGGRPAGGESEASRQLGLVRQDVHRARKVASLSEPAQEKARELGLDDNRSALLEAARETEPEEQVRTLERRATKAPDPDHELEAREKWLKKIISLWNKAGQDWRQEFLQRVDQ